VRDGRMAGVRGIARSRVNHGRLGPKDLYGWLGQGAQAIRDAELLDAVSECHTQTLRGMKWTVTRLKAAAPQVLAG
jgi:hypothetical protein